MRKYIFIFFIICTNYGYAINNDSLLTIFNNNKLHDTTQLNAIKNLSKSFIFSKPDSALFFSKKQLNFAKLKNKKPFIADAYRTIGTSYYIMQDIDSALVNYKKCLTLYKELNDEPSIAAILNNMGIVYELKGDYLDAINCYLDGLTIREKTNNTKSISKLNINLGNVYTLLGEFSNAKSHYNNAYSNFLKLNDSTGIAIAYMALGLVYKRNNQIDSSLIYFEKSKNLYIKLNDLKGLNQCRSNMGIIYMENNDFEKAKIEFELAKEYFDKTSDVFNISTLYRSIGDLNNYYKNYNKSVELCSKSLQIGIEYKLKETIKSSCLCLYKAYKGLNNNIKALSYYEQFVELKDSLHNEDLTRKVAQTEMQHAFDKKQLTDSLVRAEQERIKEINHQREVEKQKTYAYLGGSGAILLLIVLIVLFKGYNQKKKSNMLLEQKNTLITQQKQEVEKQKHLVEEKNLEITDSINYAQRIQSAILPDINIIKKYFSESFILFKPKDVVSGDFYWFENLGNKVIFAVADCTGHGVPGAMVSVVCSNALYKAVIEFNITQPSLILNKVREIVVDTFGKNNEDVKDGMDIAICSLESNKNSFNLEFSGANNPLWILKKDTKEMIEVKGDKQPVGVHFDSKPFTNHQIKLEKDDKIYLFSDGYPDQFGGEKGKKFKYKPFKELIIESSSTSLENQKEVLSKKIENWKGQLEQVDDICIIGIKV
ncbi:MAG: tetratricopeptide repeat protein [Flavobacteriales bacterium]|jgi:serine phosphatase RsbU (regulator of sigma subunit)/Flp pilus assembly protein TadD|nr:tetratricopeptide repeat protein [Flavobacteriales bacterium]MCW8911969.1 tetratricopeptide repeat protein [Flavobacteriales bacterium]MCW8937083.1 tetratricopeptide repeat protein [Flavobacteriales bacterium]MCW8941032.1 tetratricopeptide repeat protein [Flavobacteriales bacterium]MCW8968812.1 tetratricopeptide repeat protein [Flavobacteriales bacterium]